MIVIEALFFMLIWNFFKIKALQLEATIDPLTKVYNRTGFEAALKSWIKKHPDQPFTLLMIDVDDFKFFNDYYGHQVGDEVLTRIGNMLARSQNSGLPLWGRRVLRGDLGQERASSRGDDQADS